MAAATGYGDAPTDEQLLAHANAVSRNCGQAMAEVFAVRVPAAAGGHRPPPCGTISFHGNINSSVIYSRSPADEPTSLQPCDSQGNLVLTGPSLATSAFGPIAFVINLYDGSQESPSQDDVSGQNSLEISHDSTDSVRTENKAIVETVSTRYGPADVIYAILRNAVQGQVAVKLARQNGSEDHAGIVGTIIARRKLFDVGCVLFYNEHKEKVRVGSGEMIPLARDVLAVPLCMLLTVELDLSWYSGDEIVKAAVEFNPAIKGQHMERVMGMAGAEIEVAISWLDYPW